MGEAERQTDRQHHCNGRSAAALSRGTPDNAALNGADIGAGYASPLSVRSWERHGGSRGKPSSPIY